MFSKRSNPIPNQLLRFGCGLGHQLCGEGGSNTSTNIVSSNVAFPTCTLSLTMRKAINDPRIAMGPVSHMGTASVSQSTTCTNPQAKYRIVRIEIRTFVQFPRMAFLACNLSRCQGCMYVHSMLELLCKNYQLPGYLLCSG